MASKFISILYFNKVMVVFATLIIWLKTVLPIHGFMYSYAKKIQLKLKYFTVHPLFLPLFSSSSIITFAQSVLGFYASFLGVVESDLRLCSPTAISAESSLVRKKLRNVRIKAIAPSLRSASKVGATVVLTISAPS